MTLLTAAVALTACWCFAQPTTAPNPAGDQQQKLVLPPPEVDVEQIFQQLQGNDQAGSAAAALQWLLRREDALKLGYFQAEAIRFNVEHVTQVRAADGTWRLVEAAYLSRNADRFGGIEHRPRWPVAYVFDPRGRLRDWVPDYDVAILQDINRDGDLDLAAYLDSPKRVIVYSFQRGRSRELLRVDEVPEHGDLIRTFPGAHGGEVQVREKPLAIIDNNVGAPRQLKVASHGIYEWDARQQRYVSRGAGEK